MKVNKCGEGGWAVEPRDEGTEEGRDEGIPTSVAGSLEVSQYVVRQQGGKGRIGRAREGDD
jgi:hypothetical protein